MLFYLCLYRMSLFNSTIQQLTNSINEVLTECYMHIYGGQTFGSKRDRGESKTRDDDDSYMSGLSTQWGKPFDKSTRVELVLLTSPLSASEEIINVYNAGLADFELAAPIVLSSIGASNNDIAAMMERFKKNKSTMSAASQPKETTGTNNNNNNNNNNHAKSTGAAKKSDSDDTSKKDDSKKDDSKKDDSKKDDSKKDGSKKDGSKKDDSKKDDDEDDGQKAKKRKSS